MVEHLKGMLRDRLLHISRGTFARKQPVVGFNGDIEPVEILAEKVRFKPLNVDLDDEECVAR